MKIGEQNSNLNTEGIKLLQDDWAQAKYSQRERKRNDNPAKFIQNSSAERSSSRANKRLEDEVIFKGIRAVENQQAEQRKGRKMT